MLGSRRNRCRNGAKECVYGCCRQTGNLSKSIVRRIIRRRERQAWRREESQ